MKRVVRFVEDDNPYTPGDFGDDGEDTMRQIESHEVIVVAMIVYDEDAITDLTTPLDLVLNRTPDALLDSLWCITVESNALNDLDRDWEPDNVANITNDYLRHLATETLAQEAFAAAVAKEAQT